MTCYEDRRRTRRWGAAVPSRMVPLLPACPGAAAGLPAPSGPFALQPLEPWRKYACISTC